MAIPSAMPIDDFAPRPLTVSEPRWRRFLLRLGISLAAPMAVTLLMRSAGITEFELVELVFLAVVVLVARLGRMWPALMAGGVSLAALMYDFTPPADSFGVSRREDQIGLLLFAVVSFALARALSSERRARERATVTQRRLAFVAEANYLLSSARLDYERTLERLARLLVPEMADWCTVEVLLNTGKIDTVAFAHSSAINTALVESLRHQSQPDLNARAGVGAVIRTGRSERYERVGNEVLEAIARDARHLALLRGLKVRSMMKVPLFIRGKPSGAITLASVQRRRRFSEADLLLAEDLAARAASAIENARLYEERVEAARTLQRSLLPAAIPEVPGLEIAELFRPHGEGDLVGGDFYDIFATDDGWAFVIGDVCGKGVEAAALTGLVRHTIRATATGSVVPSDLLEMLNDSILRQEMNRFCTVLFAVGRLRAGGYTVTLAAGGHPLPIVARANGEATPVGRSGTLLGVFEEVVLEDVTVELGPGDALVMYTDGLLDERISSPEVALADRIKPCIGLSAREMATRIDHEAPAVSQDDRAILVLRVPEPG